jgi:hypothetical protein
VIVVDFPLRGEWAATATPAEKVPSHGTDYFGQRYAFDFVRFDPKVDKFYSRSIARHFFGRMPVEAFLCWDQPVHSCFDGVVVTAADGWPERRQLNYFREMFRSSDIQGTDYRPLAGNYVVVEGEAGFAMYAHLREGSVSVRVGDRVELGQLLGRVGNSGNSTMPHLHFQLMDGADPLRAPGMHCAFKAYERFDGSQWVRVENGVPGVLERIRSTPGG